MEIKFYGANCIRISTKNKNITIDDNLASLGAKNVAKPDDALFFTSKRISADYTDNPRHFIVQEPGEYELGSIMTQGISTRAHTDHEGEETAVILKFVVERTTIGVLGHVHPDISDKVLEELGMVDILFIPVGGNGYTLDAQAAIRLSQKIDPRIVIPTHYEDKDLNFEVPQTTLETFLAELKQEVETEDSLKIKAGSILETSTIKTIVLNKS